MLDFLHNGCILLFRAVVWLFVAPWRAGKALWRLLKMKPNQRAHEVDTWVRLVDWQFNRARTGPMYLLSRRDTDRDAAWHSPLIVLMYLALVGILLWMPLLAPAERHAWFFGGFCLLFFAGILLSHVSKSNVLYWQTGMIFALCLGSVVSPELVATTQHIAGEHRRHILLWIALLVLLLACIYMPYLARNLLRELRNDCRAPKYKLRKRLRKTDLFERPASIPSATATPPKSEEGGWLFRNAGRLTLLYLLMLLLAGLYLYLNVTSWDYVLLGILVLVMAFPLLLPGFASVLVTQPDLLILPVAASYLFLPRQWWAYALLIALFVVVYAVLYLAGTSSRLSEFTDTLRGIFFRGMTRFVSYAVVITAFLRLVDWSYVSTILDSSPGTVLSWFVAAYLLLWLYDYWADRILNEHLLSLLQKHGSRARVCVFRIQDTARVHRIRTKPRRIQVHTGGRFVVVGRITDEAQAQWPVGRIRFQFHERRELFRHIIEESNIVSRVEMAANCTSGIEPVRKRIQSFYRRGCPGNSDGHKADVSIAHAVTRVTGSPADPARRLTLVERTAVANDLRDCEIERALSYDEHAYRESRRRRVPISQQRPAATPGRLRERDVIFLDKLNRAIGLYFVCAYFPILLAAVGMSLYLVGAWDLIGWGDPRQPAIDVSFADSTDSPDNTHSLRDELFGASANSSGRSLLVAASGGGTRAALFTTSLLQGLHRVGALDDVDLMSGASGGMLALAYYATHQRELMTAGADTGSYIPDAPADQQGPWARFHDTMARPYINDVLVALTECRVSSGTPLATVLAEAFRRESGVQHSPLDRGVLPLIVNTTVCGRAPVRYPNSVNSANADMDDEQYLLDPANSSALLTGSRLAFTNLEGSAGFPTNQTVDAQEQPTLPEQLSFRVVQHAEIDLFAAAALSANFPPVFPNAAVMLRDQPNDGDEVYWVTDGGVMENRAAISLMFALRGAIEEQLKSNSAPDSWPDIHIIVAEASRVGLEYSADNGFQAIQGAGTQLAYQLMYELLLDVREKYAALQQKHGGPTKPIEIHCISMPSVLRMHAGVGTHWMLPDIVEIASIAADGPPTVRVGSDDLRRLLYVLHLADGVPQMPTEDQDLAKNVHQLLVSDPFEESPFKRWEDLREDLNR